MKKRFGQTRFDLKSLLEPTVLALSEQIPRDLSLISKSLRVVIAQIFDFGSLNGWTDGRRDF